MPKACPSNCPLRAPATALSGRPKSPLELSNDARRNRPPFHGHYQPARRRTAAWLAIVEDGLVKEWRVYADNKPVYDILAKSNAQ
jgi:hypothetical protein